MLHDSHMTLKESKGTGLGLLFTGGGGGFLLCGSPRCEMCLDGGGPFLLVVCNKLASRMAFYYSVVHIERQEQECLA